MSKTLTEELIQKRLEDKGWSVPHETHQEDKISKLRDEYDFEIISDWDKCDAYFYTDETRDGYQIWIATEQEGNVCINEDVYYYENEWFEKLADYLIDGCRVYLDSYSQDEYGFEEVIETLYEELYMKIYDDMEEVLKGLGYEYEKQ